MVDLVCLQIFLHPRLMVLVYLHIRRPACTHTLRLVHTLGKLLYVSGISPASSTRVIKCSIASIYVGRSYVVRHEHAQKWGGSVCQQDTANVHLESCLECQR